MNDLNSNAVFGDIAAIPGFSEPISSWTHLLAALAAVVVGWILIKAAAGRKGWQIAIGIFTFGAVFLLSMSGTYHLLEPDSTGRAVLQRLDHAGIWLLIAGTFTPLHIIAFKGFWRWSVLAVVWVAALAGLVLKTVYFHEMSEMLGLIFYLSLGWMGALSGFRLLQTRGWEVARWMVYGGLFYSAGALMEFMRWPILIPHVVGPHEIFHLGVIGGAACHARLVFELLRERKSSQSDIPGLPSPA